MAGQDDRRSSVVAGGTATTAERAGARTNPSVPTASTAPDASPAPPVSGTATPETATAARAAASAGAPGPQRSPASAGETAQGPVLRAVAPGSYPYRARVTDAEGSFEIDGRIVVREAREVGGETHQEHLDIDEEYGASSEEYVWRAEGVFLHAVGDGSGDTATRCDYEPDVLAYPAPLTVGREWAVDSSCRYEIEGEVFTDHLQGTARVARTDRLVVGGEEVEVYVIESRGQLRDGGTLEFEETEFFAPSVGLTVRAEGRYVYHADGYPADEVREEFELLTVRPR